MSEQQHYCAYEHCQQPIETAPGHRRKEYCNDTCRQAAHRLRKEREEHEKKANLNSSLTKYQSPQLRTILECTLQEQGAAALMRLIEAIDDEQEHARTSQGSHEGLMEQQRYETAAEPPHTALTTIQAYLHVHQGGSIPLQRGRKTLQIAAVRDDGISCVIGQGMLALHDEDVEQMCLWITAKAGTSSIVPVSNQREHQVLDQRIAELEAERVEWRAWKEAQIAGYSALSTMRQYLQEHPEAVIPVFRNGARIQIMALGNDAIAVTESHGIVRLNDDELEQGRVWVLKKRGLAILATRLPIGEPYVQEDHQVEQELAEARAEARTAQIELSKYLAPPRALLACTLRQWSTRTKVFFQDKTLAGDDLDTFIRESSDHRLQQYIASAKGSYFIGKHHQQRIRVVAEAIEHGAELLYRGDRNLVITGIDEQGYVTFASGDRTWLTIDDVQMLWALVVVEEGQPHVGGNAAVARLQQHLCDHPGESILIRRGKDIYQIVVVDDDALAVTENLRSFKLYEDDIEQAQRWIESKRDTKSA